MSLNDFENVPDLDDVIVSKIGASVRSAMSAKQNLQSSIAEAIDSSTNFGYELGAEDMKLKLIQAFEAEDSACVGWALGVIESAVN